MLLLTIIIILQIIVFVLLLLLLLSTLAEELYVSTDLNLIFLHFISSFCAITVSYFLAEKQSILTAFVGMFMNSLYVKFHMKYRLSPSILNLNTNLMQ
jgi:pheromone shutdown protein TraB